MVKVNCMKEFATPQLAKKKILPYLILH